MMRPGQRRRCSPITVAFTLITSAITFTSRFALLSSRSVVTAFAQHQKQPSYFSRSTGTCAWASTTTSINNMVVSPPVARRDDDGVVLAGVAPEGWDPKIPRQAESSQEKLLDPPRPVP